MADQFIANGRRLQQESWKVSIVLIATKRNHWGTIYSPYPLGIDYRE